MFGLLEYNCIEEFVKINFKKLVIKKFVWKSLVFFCKFLGRLEFMVVFGRRVVV